MLYNIKHIVSIYINSIFNYVILLLIFPVEHMFTISKTKLIKYIL